MSKSQVSTQIFYHGTAAEKDFTTFEGDVVYLAPERVEAEAFAFNPILAKGKQGKPRVLEIQTKPGKIKNIDRIVTDAVFNDDDIDEVISYEAHKARFEGYRYLEFEHPGRKRNYLARIALYPKEDLIIND